MSFGKLVVVCGPMFAGKTTYLINGLNVKYIDHVSCRKPRVYKHSHDLTRRGTEHIVSHQQEQYAATCLNDDGIREILYNKPMFKEIITKHDWVLFDEVQFFNSKLIFNLCRKFLSAGLNVCCAGLNQDSFGKPFGGIGSIMAIADSIILLYAQCKICKKNATKTQRLIDATEKVVIGGEDMYQPMCLEHWSQSPKKD